MFLGKILNSRYPLMHSVGFHLCKTKQNKKKVSVGAVLDVLGVLGEGKKIVLLDYLYGLANTINSS